MEENNMTVVNPGLNSATGGISYSVSVLFYFAASLIISVIIAAFSLEPKSDAYLYLSYLASPVAIAASVATMLKVRKVGFKSIVPVKCHFKYYVIGVLLIFGLLFSLGWINGLTVEFFKLFGYVPRENESYFPDMSGGKVAAALLVIAVLPAVFEELLFRGLILNSIENGMGTVRTVFVVGFCFSLFHTSPEQTVYQFIVGCAFAFIAVRSRSIMPSVLMHFINNAIIVILQACGAFDEAGSLMISPAGNIVLTVISALSLVGALIWLILDRKPIIKCQSGGVKKFFVFASAGIGVLGIVWILSLFGVA